MPRQESAALRWIGERGVFQHGGLDTAYTPDGGGGIQEMFSGLDSNCVWLGHVAAGMFRCVCVCGDCCFR